METLHEAAQRHFESEMLVHLRVFSPPLFAALGEQQMRKVVHLGVGQAASHGFTCRGPVRLYLELMLLFGSYFDTDPQYPWAAEILADPDEDLQMQRAEQLYEKTIDYRQVVAGPKDAHTVESLGNIAALLSHPLPRSFVSLEHFVSAMLREIAILYPQKAGYVGPKGLEDLIRKGIDTAQRQNVSTVQGAILVILLMLIFGHACASDPLYPWIFQIMTNEGAADPGTIVARLAETTQDWIKYLLVDIEKQTTA